MFQAFVPLLTSTTESYLPETDVTPMVSLPADTRLIALLSEETLVTTISVLGLIAAKGRVIVRAPDVLLTSR